jgi:hypothetical protein
MSAPLALGPHALDDVDPTPLSHGRELLLHLGRDLGLPQRVDQRELILTGERAGVVEVVLPYGPVVPSQLVVVAKVLDGRPVGLHALAKACYGSFVLLERDLLVRDGFQFFITQLVFLCRRDRRALAAFSSVSDGGRDRPALHAPLSRRQLNRQTRLIKVTCLISRVKDAIGGAEPVLATPLPRHAGTSAQHNTSPRSEAC